jgi:dihydroneopterin aldolase
MDELILKDIRLKGKHGCFASELENPCDFSVSLRMFLNLRNASKTDSLDDTVDYPSAIAIAEGVIAGESVRLIEKLADMIAERMFGRFANLEEIEVKVRKCSPQIEWALSEVAVKLHRKRNDYIK